MVIRDEKLVSEKANSATNELYIASPTVRFAAFVIDYYIIVWPLLLLVVSPLVHAMKVSMMLGHESESYESFILTCILGWLFILFYQAAFVAFASATPGMKIMKIKVVQVWDQSQKPYFLSAFVRAVYWSLSFALLGLPFLAVLSDPKRRAWHDRMMNTIVLTSHSRFASLRPTLQERTYSRVIVWLFVGLFSAALSSAIYYEIKRGPLRTKIEKRSITESSSDCGALEAAYESWPLENGEEASRLSVAMALFAASQLDKSCLEQEARNPFLSEKDLSLSYLAKSFIYSENQELSDLYLEQVCSTSNEKNDECTIAEVIDAMSTEKFSVVDQKFSELQKNSRVYSKIWALRQYTKEERYEEAEEFLEALPDENALSPFSMPLRVKVLWGLKKSQEAQASARVAYDALSGEDKLNLASWMCYEESQLSCESLQNTSCKIFQKEKLLNEKSTLELQPALASLKMADCQKESETSIQDLALERLHPEVQALVDLKLSKNLLDMRKMAARQAPYEEVELEVADEALISLFEMTNSDDDVKLIQQVWSEKAYGMRWEQLGLRLFSFWENQKKWSEAVIVGEKLAAVVKDASFLKDYAVALYRSGLKQEANELIADIEGFELSRSPASVLKEADDYTEVVELLQKEDAQ